MDVATEVDEDGRLAYDEVDISTPRQSMKTTLIKVKTVWRLSVYAAQHGPQRSVYIAQRRKAARLKLEQDFAENLRRAKGYREIETIRGRPKKPNEWKLLMNNGNEHVRFGSGYWLIDAPKDDAVHGDTLDDGTIDEAFTRPDDGVEGALRPAMQTRQDAQLWVASTAGTSESLYWYRKILAGQAACKSGEHGRTAFFDWSIPDDEDIGNPEVWWRYIPGLSGGTVTERVIASAWAKAQRDGPEAIDTFRRGYGNQWPHPPILGDDKPTVMPRWHECRLPTGDEVPAFLGPVQFAIDVSPGSRSTAVCVAGDVTGRTLVHVAAHQPGTSWAVDTLTDLMGTHANHGDVVVDPAGPAGALISELEAAGIKVAKVSASQHGAAREGIAANVADLSLQHLGHAGLTAAVKGAKTRKFGDLELWARMSTDVDIAPLVGVTLARWGHLRPRKVRSGGFTSR